MPAHPAHSPLERRGSRAHAQLGAIPAEMDAGSRFKNSRIKTMLKKCSVGSQSDVECYNKENQPLVHQTKPPNEKFKENSSTTTKSSTLKNKTPEELVNIINAAKYSMSTSVFRNLNETKTSQDLEPDLLNLITTLNANFPPKSNDTFLKCNETMPPLSPSSPCQASKTCLDPPLPHISNENSNPSSPTTLLNSPIDFSSDDSVKDKDYRPSDEALSIDEDSSDISNKSCHIRQIETSDNNEEYQTQLEDNSCIEPEPSSSFVANTVTAKKLSSLREKKMEKKKNKILTYGIKTGCNEKCIKKCTNKFDIETRKNINKEYWALNWQERRLFIKNCTSVAIPKRKLTSEPKRAPRSTFTLKIEDGTKVEVCKTFFLTTLGFHKNNDTVLYNSLNKNPVDRRGMHTKTAPFDRKILTDHVESFQPVEPHYRREHAPHRRYIACDVTITMMHKDFCDKHPIQKVSYELYRKHVKDMNISFTKLGNEECEVCEAYELHIKSASHSASNVASENCSTCSSYAGHKDKYKKARNLYESHKKNKQSDENIYYSVDLQKVIMLPRLDSFKSIIFCPRLTAFNLTFAPVGKITSQHKPLACIWHDGISGRKQEDIMSGYYHFILQHRDVKNITIWMDNCSAQNKNWLLFSLMIYLINSDLIATETITFQYFEPGHTFMSCDQFHHQVELAMKKKGKLYDFQDFVECVASANQSRADVKAMEAKDFFTFQNCVSDRRIQSSTPRLYLKDIIEVCFQRKNYDVLYKNEVDEDDYKVFRLMTDRYLKNPDVVKPVFKCAPKGIEKSRKDAIIKVIKDISVPHKMQFWYDMPETTDSGHGSTK